MSEFLTFRMIVDQIDGQIDRHYIAAVAEAPVNRSYTPFVDLGTIERLAERLQIQVHPKRLGELRLSHAGDVLLRRSVMGRLLFRFLFPQNSKHLEILARSCARADHLNTDLRLQLEVNPSLASLPWEIAECPDDDPHAAEIQPVRITITRYLGDIGDASYRHSKMARESTPAAEPVVVIVRADPQELSNRKVSESLKDECDQIVAVLQQEGIGYRIVDAACGKAEPDYNTCDTLARTMHELHDNNKMVVGLHMIGHGGIDDEGSYFVGEDSQFRPRPIYASDLRRALDPIRTLRWAIINACSCGDHPAGIPLGGLATSLAVLKRIPTVIAYTRPVDTGFAENLAKEFYTSTLVKGRSIEQTLRKIQMGAKGLEGLVLLQSSLDGRICESIDLDTLRGKHSSDAATKPDASSAGGARTQDKGAAQQAAAAGSAERAGTEGTARAGGPSADTAPSTAPHAPAGARFDDMVLVKGGLFQKGLTPRQVDVLMSQLEKLPIDPSSLRNLLQSLRNVFAEHPAEQMEIPTFRMDKYLVTNQRFEAFVKECGYRTTAENAGDRESWRTYYTAGKEYYPVVCISFRDAQAFARWSNKRLPTAEEWQKASRGTDGRLYPWGNSYDANLCNTAESCAGLTTTPVDHFPNGASPYGCLDMLGNVEEFTSTTDKNGNRQILGGSWEMTCQVYGLPVLSRLADDSTYTRDLGFRCVQDV